MATCTVCGGHSRFMMSMCDACIAKQNSQATTLVKESLAQALVEKVVEEEPSGIVLTTTHSLDGFRISRVVDVLSAEYFFKATLFRDIASVLLEGPITGSGAQTQTGLGQGRAACLDSLRRAAVIAGANAVVGVTLSYAEFNGHGSPMVMLAATGTAVVLESTIPPPSLPHT